MQYNEPTAQHKLSSIKVFTGTRPARAFKKKKPTCLWIEVDNHLFAWNCPCCSVHVYHQNYFHCHRSCDLCQRTIQPACLSIEFNNKESNRFFVWNCPCCTSVHVYLQNCIHCQLPCAFCQRTKQKGMKKMLCIPTMCIVVNDEMCDMALYL